MDSLVRFLRMVFISLTFFYLCVIEEAKGTLTPNGTVLLDCGSQHTFTCSVNGTAAVWAIRGLTGIITSAGGYAGTITANLNDRITTTDSGVTTPSTITITWFTTSDDGGTIQCFTLAGDGSVQGMASLSVDVPSCPSSVIAVAHDDNDAITLTWQLPPDTPPVTSTTVTYCPTSSPNCGHGMNCTSPCTISGLDPDTEYQFTVVPNNNCGSPTDCTGNRATAQTACICPSQPSTVEAPLLVGIIPSVVLLLSHIISVVVAVLVTRYCCNSSSQKSSPRHNDVHEQVEGSDSYEDIPMSTNPAYGPVIQN